MSEALTPSRSDNLMTRLLAALIVITPLIHSAVMAEAFFLPKEIVVLCGALLVLLAALLTRSSRHAAAGWRSPVFVLLALLLAAAALAILPSFNRGIAVRGFVQLAAGAVIAWGVARFVRTAAGAELLLRSLLAVATLIAIATLAQVFYPGLRLAPGGWSLLPAGTGATTLGSTGLTMQFLLLGLPAGVGAAALSRGMPRSLCGASLGLIGAAVLFAGRPEGWTVAIASLVLLACSACLRVSAHGGSWRDCIPSPGGDGLRTALIGVITLLAVLALSRTPLGAPTGIPPAPLSGVSLLTPTSGDPAVDRHAAIAGAVPLLLRHPLGVGPGLWRHAFLEVAWTENPDSPFTLNHQSSHVGNAFVEILAETGIAGGALFILLLAVVLLQAGYAARVRRSSLGLVGFTVFNAVGTFAFASLYGSMMQSVVPALIFWIMVGLSQVSLAGADCSGLPRTLRPRDHEPAPAPAGRLTLMLGLLAWATIVILATVEARHAIAASRLSLAAQAASLAGQSKTVTQILESPEISRSPDHVPHFLAATAYLAVGEMEKGALTYGRVIERSPYFISAYLGRAHAYSDLGYYDRAEQDLDTALAIWPTHLDTRMARARLDALRGRSIEALEAYRSVLRDDPSRPEPFFRMGQLLAEQGNLDEAIQAYRACLSKDPHYPAVHLHMADVFDQKGMLKLAVQYYEAAIGSAPKDAEPRLKLANTLYGMSRFCEARIALEGARDVVIEAEQRATILELIDKVSPLCRKGGKKKTG